MRLLWWVQRNVQFCCCLLTVAVVLLLGSIHGQHQGNHLHVRASSSGDATPVLQAAHQQHQQNKEQQHFQQLHQQHSQQQLRPQPAQQHSQQQQHPSSVLPVSGHGSGGHNMYSMLSHAMSEAVSHEFSGTGSGGSAAEGTCLADDLDCLGNVHDRLGMEAIRSLHQQLDDDENGNIDLTESDDFLREELKYDSGYEKRHKTFHYNDDTQISVKELWEAWLRSEVHNWTMEQTTDWLAQSVQLPQYVELFQKHKVNGATLPRLAVHNMHYVSTVLGIRDPIHKQKIALKAMDVVLFGPPRETGNRWKDYFLVTLLLGAIIGCWYAYQQNKNAKRHLRRMAKDMEGLQRAENLLTDMQKELELARLAQENVATEKLDLERRLREAPSLTSSSSDLELQQLKQEVEMLRAELSRAEVELVDHCWTPPPALQSWLQLTFELESKHALKQRVSAEKQLQVAREACEKLKRKRASLVGAFVSTHGKSMDDVDRSIVVARNSLSEVTNEMQERMHRWKQIESMMGFNILNNNGLAYLESVLYSRNGGGSSGKSSRNRMSGSQDELDDESSAQETHGAGGSSGGGTGATHARLYRDDSSGSDDGDTVTFIVGSESGLSSSVPANVSGIPIANVALHNSVSGSAGGVQSMSRYHQIHHGESVLDEARSLDRIMPLPRTKKPIVNSASSSASVLTNSSNCCNSGCSNSSGSSAGQSASNLYANDRASISSLSSVRGGGAGAVASTSASSATVAPMPPPRRSTSHQSLHRTASTDMESMEPDTSTAEPSAPYAPIGESRKSGSGRCQHQQQPQHQQQQQHVQHAVHSTTGPSMDGDACSTDSSGFDGSSIASNAAAGPAASITDAVGAVEHKKRRRKLPFSFGRRSKKSASPTPTSPAQ